TLGVKLAAWGPKRVPNRVPKRANPSSCNLSEFAERPGKRPRRSWVKATHNLKGDHRRTLALNPTVRPDDGLAILTWSGTCRGPGDGRPLRRSLYATPAGGRYNLVNEQASILIAIADQPAEGEHHQQDLAAAAQWLDFRSNR